MNAIGRDAASISVSELRERLTGSYVTPEDSGWHEARLAWNLAVDQRPAAVAIPETVDDIVEVVRYARANGLRVAGQATGHNARPLADGLDRTVLVKTHRMRQVKIDPKARVARVEPGTLWMDVTYPAGEHGLTPLAGSSPDVGVAGYVLGGGISWLARKYGLATNSVVGIELVNAEGNIVRASATTMRTCSGRCAAAAAASASSRRSSSGCSPSRSCTAAGSSSRWSAPRRC